MAGAHFPLENRRCERARQWSSLRLDGETPPEPPQIRFEIPKRTRGSFPASRRVAVAAIAAALGLGSLVGSMLHRPAATPAPEGPLISFLTRDVSQLRQIPRGTHLAPAAPARDPGEPPEGII